MDGVYLRGVDACIWHLWLSVFWIKTISVLVGG